MKGSLYWLPYLLLCISHLENVKTTLQPFPVSNKTFASLNWNGLHLPTFKTRNSFRTTILLFGYTMYFCINFLLMFLCVSLEPLLALTSTAVQVQTLFPAVAALLDGAKCRKARWHLVKGLSLHLLLAVTDISYTEICWLPPHAPCKK